MEKLNPSTKLRTEKVGVLGLGVENTPLVKWLVGQGAKVVICDANAAISPPATPERSDGGRGKQQSAISKLPVMWRAGEHYLDYLEDFSIVFRTPGLSINHPKIQEAKAKGVEISSATKVFFDLCPAKIIGVTGTKGKGTVASLIRAMLSSKLKAQSSKQKSKVFLGGNIGMPMMGFLDQVGENDLVILELSSFQLADLEKSPHIAVVLGIEPEHQDIHSSIEEYIQAKENIVKYQKATDFAVVNQDSEIANKFASKTKAQIYYFSTKKEVSQGGFIRDRGEDKELVLKINNNIVPICRGTELKIVGSHNIENILAATLATILITSHNQEVIEAIKKVATSFSGLPYRLQFISLIDGVKYFNDSYATTPQATIAAIKSFNKPIILIAGGSSKGADFTELGQAIGDSTIKLAILIGQEADRIVKAIKRASGHRDIRVEKADSLSSAVDNAKTQAQTGEIILFSPACASFDMFKNATDRGEQFNKIIKAL